MTSPNRSNQDLIIRSECTDDWQQIEGMLDSAFEGHDEAELVARIRATPEYINELTLVAIEQDIIVGFIMLSYVTLQGEADSFKVLSLGPLAVFPSVQKSGIGGSLMQSAIALAEQRDDPLIVLLGHASYYPRFGFERASQHNILPPLPWKDESYMVRLLPRYSPEIAGKIRYTPAWQIG